MAKARTQPEVPPTSKPATTFEVVAESVTGERTPIETLTTEMLTAEAETFNPIAAVVRVLNGGKITVTKAQYAAMLETAAPEHRMEIRHAETHRDILVEDREQPTY